MNSEVKDQLVSFMNKCKLQGFLDAVSLFISKIIKNEFSNKTNQEIESIGKNISEDYKKKINLE